MRLLLQPRKCARRLWTSSLGRGFRFSKLLETFLSVIAFVPSFPRSAAAILDNTTADEELTIADLEAWRAQPELFCKCHTAELQPHCDEATGHVRTTKCPRLPSRRATKGLSARDLLTEGRNYRVGWTIAPFRRAHENFRKELVTALRDFLGEHPSLAPANKTRFDYQCEHGRWDSNTKQGFWNEVKTHVHGTELLQRDIEWLHSLFKVGRADKAGNLFTTRCKWEYYWTMYCQLTESGVMAMLPPSDPRCSVKAACDAVSSFLGTAVDAPYGKYIMSLKVKKVMDESIPAEKKAGPGVERFITTGHNCPTTLPAKIITTVVTLCNSEWMAECKHRSAWVQAITRTSDRPQGRRVSFFHQINDPTEIICTVLLAYPHLQLISLFQGDLSQQYDNVPHGGESGVKGSCMEIYGTAQRHRKAQCLHVRFSDKHGNRYRRPRGRWMCTHKATTDGEICVNKESFEELLEMLIYWNVIEFLGVHFWQQRGIPTGLSCSGLIASGTLNVQDRAATLKLVKDAMNGPATVQKAAWMKAESTCLLFRKMDDVTWIQNADAYTDLIDRLSKDSDGTPFLKLNNETTKYADCARVYGIQGHMCDATLDIGSGKLDFWLYDKAREMGSFSEHFIRYFKASSYCPVSSLKSVLTGQLGRIYGVSRLRSSFIMDSLRILIRLQGNGFSYSQLSKTLATVTIPKQPYLEWQFDTECRTVLSAAFNASEQVYRDLAGAHSGHRRATHRGVENSALDLHLTLVKVHMGWPTSDQMPDMDVLADYADDSPTSDGTDENLPSEDIDATSTEVIATDLMATGIIEAMEKGATFWDSTYVLDSEYDVDDQACPLLLTAVDNLESDTDGSKSGYSSEC